MNKPKASTEAKCDALDEILDADPANQEALQYVIRELSKDFEDEPEDTWLRHLLYIAETTQVFDPYARMQLYQGLLRQALWVCEDLERLRGRETLIWSAVRRAASIVDPIDRLTDFLPVLQSGIASGVYSIQQCVLQGIQNTLGGRTTHDVLTPASQKVLQGVVRERLEFLLAAPTSARGSETDYQTRAGYSALLVNVLATMEGLQDDTYQEALIRVAATVPPQTMSTIRRFLDLKREQLKNPKVS